MDAFGAVACFMLFFSAERPEASAFLDSLPENTLFAPDPTTNANFGTSLSADGNIVVVGAPNARNPENTIAGAAYVFERSGGNWLW